MNLITSSDPNAKRKIAAVAILAIVFAVVVGQRIVQFSGANPQVELPSRLSVRSAPSSLASQTSESTSYNANAKLPSIELSRLLRTNPFTPLPEAHSLRSIASTANVFTGPLAADGSAEDQIGAIEPVEVPNDAPSQVNAIVFGERRGVLIDGQFVQEQDTLSDGWRVISIGVDSIVIEKSNESR